MTENIQMRFDVTLAELTELYNVGYHAGHEDTVEGTYLDVLPVDMREIHGDIVGEWWREL